MSTRLPTAPGPLVTELAVDAPVAFSIAGLTAAFAARGVPLRETDTLTEGQSVFIRSIRGGGELRVDSRPSRIAPDRLVKPLADASKWWPAADALALHRATVVVSAQSDVVPSPSLAQFHAQATAAVIDVAIANGATVRGVFWNGERLYPAEFVQTHAASNPALGLLVGFHVPAPNPETSVYTTGLSVLGLKNIEADAISDVNTAASMVQSMALYLLRHGNTISDGHTVGYAPTQHILIREAEASWGGERVLRLALEEP